MEKNSTNSRKNDWNIFVILQYFLFNVYDILTV